MASGRRLRSAASRPLLAPPGPCFPQRSGSQCGSGHSGRPCRANAERRRQHGIGAALHGWHQITDHPRVPTGEIDGMSGAYLGPDFPDVEIEAYLEATLAMRDPGSLARDLAVA